MLKSQKLKEYEIIFVDDFSIDNGNKIINKIKEHAKRIKMIKKIREHYIQDRLEN